QGIACYTPSLKINPKLINELKSFILERLHSYYQNQGLSTDLVQAVRACQDEWLFDLDKRLNALQTFITLPEAAALSAACKRVSNLLNHAGTQSLVIVNEALLLE